MHRVRRPWLPAQCKASLVPHPCPGPTAMLPATLGDVHMRQIRKLDSMYICVNCKIKKKPEKEITDSLAELPGSPSVFSLSGKVLHTAFSSGMTQEASYDIRKRMGDSRSRP